MLDKYLITYNHEESIVHLINPMVKLVSFVLYLIACFFPFNTVIFSCLMISVFLLIILSNISILKYLRVLWLYRYLLLIIYFSLYAMGKPIFNINVLLFKVMFGILFIYVILFTIKKDDLGEYGGSFVNLINIIGIPVKKIKNAFCNFNNFILIFIDQFNSSFEINAIKGNDAYFGTILKKISFCLKHFKEIYSKTKEINDDRKKDMKYRLYEVDTKKIYKYRSKLTVFDYILIIVYVFIYVYYIVKVR